MNPTANRVAIGALILLNVALTALAIQLAAGAVPIPDGWAWAVPVLTAVVTAATTLLPRVGSEGLSVQVDALRARNIPRSEMVVVPRRRADLTPAEIEARFPDGPAPRSGEHAPS